jgi:hypothetical protein
MKTKDKWLKAYRAARSMAYGTLHASYERHFAAAAKESAEFRRGIHGGHRSLKPYIYPLSLRLLYRKAGKRLALA